MFKDNGRLKTESGSSTRTTDKKIMVCPNCSKETLVEVAVFGENLCNYCGSMLTDDIKKEQSSYGKKDIGRFMDDYLNGRIKFRDI